MYKLQFIGDSGIERLWALQSDLLSGLKRLTTAGRAAGHEVD